MHEVKLNERLHYATHWTPKQRIGPLPYFSGRHVQGLFLSCGSQAV